MEEGFFCLLCNNKISDITENTICPKCGYNQFGQFKRDISSPHKALIIKIGNLDTLQSMINGNIWFQSPKYYQSYKGNQSICDINECAFDSIIETPIEQIHKAIPYKIGDKIVQEGRELILKEITGGHVCVYSNTQNYNRLLCFYTLKIDKDGKTETPNELIRNFGTHFSLIHIDKLSGLVDAYAEENNIGLWRDWVKYLTDNYRGAYNPTCKDNSYSYQNEYRFILRSEALNKMDEEEPLKIKFKSKDIAEIMTEPQSLDRLFEVNDLKELFKLFSVEE